MNAKDHARKMLAKRNHPDLYNTAAPAAVKAVKPKTEKVSEVKAEETSSVKEPKTESPVNTEAAVQEVPENTDEVKPVTKKKAAAKKVEVTE